MKRLFRRLRRAGLKVTINKHSDLQSILVREGQHVGIRPDASHGASALSLPSLAVFACPQSAFTTHEV
ncbi:hypothetical protein NGA_0460701, partial [Nannochloropsis gaditana CCMP526]|uniref:uncharacterized protein n=1 Tax=Nannochloropsis gaditana (strain CCMP526) TaxID=1093141 RepID=UPI00029F66E1